MEPLSLLNEHPVLCGEDRTVSHVEKDGVKPLHPSILQRQTLPRGPVPLVWSIPEGCVSTSKYFHIKTHRMNQEHIHIMANNNQICRDISNCPYNYSKKEHTQTHAQIPQKPNVTPKLYQCLRRKESEESLG